MPVKLPRWLLFSMRAVILLACIGTAGWWVTWPERTALEFRRLLRERQFVELDELLTVGSRYAVLLLEDSDLEPEPFTIADVLCGRRRFRNVEFHGSGPIAQIFVQRGFVTCDCLWPNQLSQVLNTSKDSRLLNRIENPDGWLRSTAASIPEDELLVGRIFRQVLEREPRQEELEFCAQHLADVSIRNEGATDIVRALLQDKEFFVFAARKSRPVMTAANPR